MLRSEHCLLRAERLRMTLLTTSDLTTAARLRGLIQKYRSLAVHAKTEVESLPSSGHWYTDRRSQRS